MEVTEKPIGEKAPKALDRDVGMLVHTLNYHAETAFPAASERDRAIARRIEPAMFLLSPLLAFLSLGPASESQAVVVLPRHASSLEELAAREVRRYLYHVTGALPRLMPTDGALSLGPGHTVVVGRSDRSVVRVLAEKAGLLTALEALAPEEYLLRTAHLGSRTTTLIVGGDDVGTLYGAYRFAEKLGVRFYLDGDVLPDRQTPLDRLSVDEVGRPKFALRGIQPFHDFPEGPDWWSLDDYKAVLAQLPKLRMNFIGLHTYPEDIAEPTVWIGLSEDVDEKGRVRFSYPASYQNTLRGDWGYEPKKTSDFLFGTGALFDRDDYGTDPMRGLAPKPYDPEACNRLFNRTGDFLGQAFRFAKGLGIRTCVGTETPLIVPRRVRERYPEATTEQLYEGIFRRLSLVSPVDYYWLWTPEGWTWSGTTPEEAERTLADIRAALSALDKLGKPFGMATCGWVLGPQFARDLFARELPPDVAVSCINREVGMAPVEPGFARVRGRDKWAIPWLEDDPALTTPQLWVGRMLRDASDAHAYGCTGLMGIHWRTRVIGPNVSALAGAAWDLPKPPDAQSASGVLGGKLAHFPGNRIEGADEQAVYQHVRYDLSAYRFVVPNGDYRVTLKFCEPYYSEPGRRVFDVQIEGRTVVSRLDVFAEVGQNHALDMTYQVTVDDGRLDVEFVPVVEMPCIAGLVIEGGSTAIRINCGGPAVGAYAADREMERDLPCDAFYSDWAYHQFGAEVARDAAKLFARLDGKLPRPAAWMDGPGGLWNDARPLVEIEKQYGFVAEMEAMRPRVKGPGNLERFDYWLNSFRYLRAMARMAHAGHQVDEALRHGRESRDGEAKRAAARSALPLYETLLDRLEEVYRYLLPTIGTKGELGTLANWEQHILPRTVERQRKELEAMLGEPLAAEYATKKVYDGPTVLCVPTKRTLLEEGAALRVPIHVLSAARVDSVALHWRPLGESAWRAAKVVRVGRGVYDASLACEKSGDFEYWIEVRTSDAATVTYPAGAPTRTHSVVRLR